MTILGIAKRLRLKARYPDGSATYQMTSADGSTGLLMIGADGTRLEHVIEGVNLDKAMGLTGADTSAGPVMAPSGVTPPQPVQEPVQDVVAVQCREAVAEPAPDNGTQPVSATPPPVNPQLDRDAQMLAHC